MNAQFQFCFIIVVTINIGNDSIWVKKEKEKHFTTVTKFKQNDHYQPYIMFTSL